MITAKVFTNGNSQAVRIPKEYRFDDEEICMCKVGSAVIMFQRNDRLAILMESLNEFTPDFLNDGRPPELPQSERESFC